MTKTTDDLPCAGLLFGHVGLGIQGEVLLPHGFLAQAPRTRQVGLQIQGGADLPRDHQVRVMHSTGHATGQDIGEDQLQLLDGWLAGCQVWGFTQVSGKKIRLYLSRALGIHSRNRENHEKSKKGQPDQVV